MITKNMIDAGLDASNAYYGQDDSEWVVAIYEAMADQKQKDAMIEYKEHYKNDGLRHSDR